MSRDDHGECAIRLKGVTKSFGRTPVLRGIDLDVPTGQVLSLLGPNGSGKTTLINILATLTKADAGHVHVGGVALEGKRLSHPPRNRRRDSRSTAVRRTHRAREPPIRMPNVPP